MKVVTAMPLRSGGAAEACPEAGEGAQTSFIGASRRILSFISRHRTNLLLITLTILCFALPHLVHAEDLLANQKQDAKDTFGHGSTVEWGLYMAEIILSVGAYMKTRNPMLFIGGLAFLIVITRTFFALAG
ncbi:conjugal transfer protein TraA (plasmid) [Paramixta manurensis]|uniref:Pilin n=1 Tax=Paramixta manurensis TaxID=2740817 RepID=A0A6M8UR09_9GAMM|nr:conjugal transfer protein TraA [Erwiniaceae bacterium PD-1]